MSRRGRLLVHPLGCDPAWRRHLRTVDDLLLRTQEQSGPWRSDLVVDRYGTIHPPHIRDIGRGDMIFGATHRDDDVVEISPSSGNRVGSSIGISVTLPMAAPRNERRRPSAESTMTHARRVLAAVIEGEVRDDEDLSLVETWAIGLAAIVRSLGATAIDVRLPCRFLPLRIEGGDDHYARLTPSVRRRIATACPHLIYVDVETTSDPELLGVDIGAFSRFYQSGSGSSHDLDLDPIGTMRAMAHVMAAAGLKPEDIRP